MFLRLRSSKGFTILELLIVIAVIAILVGIALPRFKGMKDEGSIAKAKGELRTLQTAVESYYIHNSNTYPANIAAALTGATPQIIAVAPTDPFGGAAYGYLLASPYYIIWSKGPAGDGVASVTTAGVASETTDGASCIYVTNGSPADTTP
ncbi:MAG: type II secretion system protein [Candidatus Omnitrophica bacterium]|nr:type II secretion system protein [Candidatus Omnitrophota bacterium]